MSGKPGARAGYAKAVRELLSDGRWHRVSEAVNVVARMVPPGQAVRVVEANRSAKGGPAQRVRPLPLDDQVRSGQHDIAKATIYGMAARGRGVELDRPLNSLSQPGARIRVVAEDRSVSALVLARWLGWSPSALITLVIRDPQAPPSSGGGHPRSPHRFPLDALDEWATYLAGRTGPTGKSRTGDDSVLRWQPLAADLDGLWNATRREWELVDGKRITRPADRR